MRKVHGMFHSDAAGRMLTGTVTIVLSTAQWFGLEIVGIGFVLPISLSNLLTGLPFYWHMCAFLYY